MKREIPKTAKLWAIISFVVALIDLALCISLAVTDWSDSIAYSVTLFICAMLIVSGGVSVLNLKYNSAIALWIVAGIINLPLGLLVLVGAWMIHRLKKKSTVTLTEL
jgi:uncharacterized membrane protein